MVCGGDQLCELLRALPVTTDRFAAQLSTIEVSRWSIPVTANGYSAAESIKKTVEGTTNVEEIQHPDGISDASRDCRFDVWL